MEIKAGEYIRTNAGEIAEVVLETNDNFIKELRNGVYAEDCYSIGIEPNIKGRIIKHSYNIIDLIELGDFVNGLEVLKMEYYDKDGNYIEELGVEEFESIVPLREYFDGSCKIKEILTYEQYEKNVFRLEGE